MAAIHTSRPIRTIVEASLVVLIIALIVDGNDLVWTNVVGLALVLHLVVLLVATFRGFVAGSIAAIAAATGLALLLDPAGSLRISEPANWVAFVSFLFSAAIASRLVTRAQVQAEEARRREEELARLYQLSIDLFGTSGRHNVFEHALRLGLEALGASRGCLIEIESGEDPRIIVSVGRIDDWIVGLAKRASEGHETIMVERDGERAISVARPTPGGARVLAVIGTPASRGAVESVAALVSLAAERERLLASATHLAALEESDRLKTGMLRAVSHDLSTPLATITIEIEALEREVVGSAESLSRVVSLRQDVGLLRRRIENLLAMARIEAGTYHPHPEPLPAADLFRSVRQHLGIVASGRLVEVRIDPECPDIYIDPSLALEIVGNLVDNAHRASPEGVSIELAARNDSEHSRVIIEVLDRGHGLHGTGLMVEGDAAPSGLGLEIARSLTEASRGTLQLVPRAGGGMVARLTAPAFLENPAK